MKPLLGDAQGRYKVQLVGNSGSGKSTTGAALASLLGVPFIPIDTLHWQPGWKNTPSEALKTKLRTILDQNKDRGWVIDGDYNSLIGNMVLDECTDVIWLDPPLILYFPRLFLRTMLRLLRLCPPCSSGCEESFREVFFSRESILWWCLSQHGKVRRRNWGRMGVIGIGVGVGGSAGEGGTTTTSPGGRKMRRFGGWGGELKKWMEDVAEMCRVV